MPLVIGHSSSIIPRRRRGGFALLITITLLAFLVLLLVSLASLTQVETRVAANTRSLSQARQNALLALNIALGQLQKNTGPDQRVTARADLVLPAGVTVTPPVFDFGTGSTGGKFTSPGSTGKTVLADVDAYWGDASAPRNRHWTGAWRNTNVTAFDRNNPAAFNPSPGRFINDDPARPDAKPVWLVSGGESSASFDPANTITGLALASTALDDSLRDAVNNTPHRLLVGRATTGAVAAGDLQRYVTAPQITLKGAAPGQTGAQDIGHYAWWIGDEGIKTRADLVDPYGPASAAPSPDPDDARNLKRRQSAQRAALEAMTIDGSDGLAPFFADLASDVRLRDLVSVSQLGYLDTAAAFRAQLDRRCHDLSVHSRGVLADTRHGGLRRDLSYILGQPSPAAFRAALNQSGFSVAPAATYNTALSATATPYATLPDNEPSGRAYDAAAGVLSGSATWEQLWSFHNMGRPAPLGVFTGTVANARPSTGAQQGLYPVLVQAKLFYSMEVSGGAITLRITPVVVLANPYNVPLAGVFRLTFPDNPRPVVLTGKLSDPPPAPESLVYATSGASAENRFVAVGNLTNARLDNGGLCKATLVVNATSIPAGAAQIFTVEPGHVINGKNHALEVPMTNTFDPSAFVTVATGLSINTVAGDTHAALYASGMAPQLHIGSTADDVNRVAYVSTKSPPSSSGAPVEFGFVVYPVDSGFRRGGGVFFALQDGKSSPQQGMFSQVNYRTLIVNHVGASGNGDHPLQWGTAYGVLGLEGDADPGPHPLLSANILPPLDETVPSTTRWGLVSSGEYPSLNTVPPEITDAATGFVNRLYDIPPPGRQPTSLGQLQHFNLAGHLSNPAAIESLKTNSFLVNYPIANSYPGPRVRRHKVFHSSVPFSHHYDASYLWNDLLWDRFTFSSFPQTGSFAFGDGEAGHLVNSRYRPFRPEAEVPLDDETRFRGVFEPAENLLVKGAFNINSTSVEAWKALFSCLKGVRVGPVATPSAPFARTLSPSGGSAGARNGVSADAWNGFNDLTQAEINELAAEMVLQVRLRGPFLSLSEFVNRRLAQGPSAASNAGLADPHRLGLSGALQAAIDRTINRKAVIPAPYDLAPRRNETVGPRDGAGAFLGLYLADLEYRAHTRLAGHPGYLLQGDVLSPLAPALSARSDTFTIRAYGDTVNPATGDIEGRAWCEAVVQRVPDYVDPSDAPEAIPAPGSVNERFGRRYQVVAFRWLAPSDI